MPFLGYTAELDRYSERELLDRVRDAVDAGFDAVLAVGAGDGAWRWLEDALEGAGVPVGLVIGRAAGAGAGLLAREAAGRLADHPGRFWLALEADPGEDGRLGEAARTLRQEWACAAIVGPAVEPPVFVRTGHGPAAAAAVWADGLLTRVRADGSHRGVARAFREAREMGSQLFLEADVAWGDDAADARRVRPGTAGPDVRVSADVDRHIEWLRRDLESGPSAIFLRDVSGEPRRFLEAFGAHVLPALTRV